MSALAAAGISGLLSIGSNLIANNQAKKAQERSNRWNIEQWDRENKYNHPVEQMARLKKAGLNPNLIYGKGAHNQAGSISPSQAAKTQFTTPDLHQIAQLKSTEAQTDNYKVQEELYKQQAALTAATTASELTRNATNVFDLNLAKELRGTSVDAAKAGLKQIEHNTVGRMIQNKFDSKTLQDRATKLFYEAQSATSQSQLDATKAALRDMGVETTDPVYLRMPTFISHKLGTASEKAYQKHKDGKQSRIDKRNQKSGRYSDIPKN